MALANFADFITGKLSMRCYVQSSLGKEESAMQDILDSGVSSQQLGTIATDPRQLAKEAKSALKNFDLPTIVFVDHQGSVFAHPSAYQNEHVVSEIVGIYTPRICIADLVDDLEAVVTPRLAAIGILTPLRKMSRFDSAVRRHA